MRKLSAVLLAVLLFLGPAASVAGETPAWSVKPPKTEKVIAEETKVVRWEGSTDLDMLKQVRSDLESATAKDSKIKVLKVYLASGGGPVITSLEIARLIRAASDKGLIVEVHGEMLVASGGTFVLAAGTPGRRYVSKSVLVLVHGVQAGGYGGGSCKDYVAEPKTEDDKAINAILRLLRNAYVLYTKKPVAEVEKWLTCGNEQVGAGDLAVTLGLADKVE